MLKDIELNGLDKSNYNNVKNMSNNLTDNSSRLDHDPKLSNLIEDSFKYENDIEDPICDNDQKETKSTKEFFFPCVLNLLLR